MPAPPPCHLCTASAPLLHRWCENGGRNHHPIWTEIWQGGAFYISNSDFSINGTTVQSNTASSVSEEKRTTVHYSLTTELPLPLHDFGNASSVAAESTALGLSSAPCPASPGTSQTTSLVLRNTTATKGTTCRFHLAPSASAAPRASSTGRPIHAQA
jgi:hypothetical protein